MLSALNVEGPVTESSGGLLDSALGVVIVRAYTGMISKGMGLNKGMNTKQLSRVRECFAFTTQMHT